MELRDKQQILAKEWLKKAEQDIFACEDLLQRERTSGIVCFHSHQTAEKSLKALVVFFNEKFEKTHDLWSIAVTLLDVVPELNKYKGILKALKSYYIESRYPDDLLIDFTPEEAKEAFSNALKIHKLAVKIIGNAGKQSKK